MTSNNKPLELYAPTENGEMVAFYMQIFMDVAHNISLTKLNQDKIFCTETIGGKAFHLNLSCIGGGVPL